MKLVRLVAPSACTFRVGETDYVVDGESREVDVPEYMVADLLAEGFKRAAARELVIMQGPQGEPGRSIKGDQGPPGPRGPIGPMPRHEWDGTELRFELEPGKWGRWVDLKGDKGEKGDNGTPGGTVGGFGAGPIDLSALNITTSTNSYFPAGW